MIMINLSASINGCILDNTPKKEIEKRQSERDRERNRGGRRGEITFAKVCLSCV
jgi:hypothetical protein